MNEPPVASSISRLITDTICGGSGEKRSGWCQIRVPIDGRHPAAYESGAPAAAAAAEEEEEDDEDAAAAGRQL